MQYIESLVWFVPCSAVFMAALTENSPSTYMFSTKKRKTKYPDLSRPKKIFWNSCYLLGKEKFFYFQKSGAFLEAASQAAGASEEAASQARVWSRDLRTLWHRFCFLISLMKKYRESVSLENNSIRAFSIFVCAPIRIEGFRSRI